MENVDSFLSFVFLSYFFLSSFLSFSSFYIYVVSSFLFPLPPSVSVKSSKLFKKTHDTAFSVYFVFSLFLDERGMDVSAWPNILTSLHMRTPESKSSAITRSHISTSNGHPNHSLEAFFYFFSSFRLFLIHFHPSISVSSLHIHYSPKVTVRQSTYLPTQQETDETPQYNYLERE